MTDLTPTIKSKSDQLNADDLIGRTMTVKITKVSLVSGDQPVSINYENDDGRPYKPCKSMRRVLVQVWGRDGNAYVGRSMTLFRDESVMFGGAAVGGIRISHMSGITSPVTMSLTASKMSKKPFTVKPLAVQGGQSSAASATASSVQIEIIGQMLVDAIDDQSLKAAHQKLSAAWKDMDKDQRHNIQALFEFHKKRIEDAQAAQSDSLDYESAGDPEPLPPAQDDIFPGDRP